MNSLLIRWRGSKELPPSGEISDGFGLLMCKDHSVPRTNLFYEPIVAWGPWLAMDDAVCADCTKLYQMALDAIIRHNYARTQLALAKLHHDAPKIRVWEPVWSICSKHEVLLFGFTKNTSIRTHKKRPTPEFRIILMNLHQTFSRTRKRGSTG